MSRSDNTPYRLPAREQIVAAVACQSVNPCNGRELSCLGLQVFVGRKRVRAALIEALVGIIPL